MVTFSISDLANEFNISTRTIRYYEERGLLNPERTINGVRTYSKKDRTVLKLILRGKKFGFSLEEIQEMLTLFDQDRTGMKQLVRTIEYCKTKEAEIQKRIDDLEGLRQEIYDVRIDFQNRVEKLKQQTYQNLKRD